MQPHKITLKEIKMANEQGWRDFDQITRMIDKVKGDVQEINNTINRLKHDKQEIIDDPVRLAEVTEIIDIHPLYTIPMLQTIFQKMTDLQIFLSDNGYLS